MHHLDASVSVMGCALLTRAYPAGPKPGARQPPFVTASIGRYQVAYQLMAGEN
jgi:hypothetical protein